MNMQEIIDFYGADMQLNICIEELSELIKELCKVKRGIPRPDNIAEEMADVKIIMKQLEIIFQNSADVDKWYAKKVDRLKTRLEADRPKGGDSDA
jgi:NTP pyrophosphatase (non-canonical NTP hydrolase)